LIGGPARHGFTRIREGSAAGTLDPTVIARPALALASVRARAVCST
jgi:hypothetical protein